MCWHFEQLIDDAVVILVQFDLLNIHVLQHSGVISLKLRLEKWGTIEGGRVIYI